VAATEAAGETEVSSSRLRSHHGPSGADVLPPLAGRLGGVDVARAVAILGMFAVHVGPLDDTTVAGRLYALPHGRASLLFVLVAGVGVSLLARSRSNSVTGARRTLLWRAAVLLPAGLLLQLLDHGVNVILQGYAALFLLAVVVLTIRDRWLLLGAGLFATVGPLVFLLGRMGDPARFAREEVVWGDSASKVVDGLVLSGPYPIVTWAAPLLLGLWLGRRDLRDVRVRRWLVLGGGGVFGASLAISMVGQRLVGATDAPAWVDLLSAAPHSQMPLWLLGGVGAACAVVGTTLWLADRYRSAMRPLVALGQFAFTAYVAHLLALAAWGEALRGHGILGSVVVVVVGAGVLAGLALLWRSVVPRGPLEALLRPPARVRDAR
jgi:uncharacterized membrane protein YeiB